MEEIQRLYKEHYNTPFPDLRGEEIQGIDLVLADADTAGGIDKFLSYQGRLTEDDFRILNHCYSDLKIITRELEGSNRQYFSRLMNIAGHVIDIVKSDRKNRIKDFDTSHKQPLWQTKFHEIRKIMNEWDPLGVADLVDDEYDSMTFGTLSVIMSDNPKENIRIVLKNYTENMIEMRIPENKLNELTEQIWNVKEK